MARDLSLCLLIATGVYANQQATPSTNISTEVNSLFNSADANHDGLLSMIEFADAGARELQARVLELGKAVDANSGTKHLALIDAFSSFDSNADGSITLHELSDSLESKEIVHSELELVNDKATIARSPLVSEGEGWFVSSFNGDYMHVHNSTMRVYLKGSAYQLIGQANNVEVPFFEGAFPWGNVYMVWKDGSWQESGSSNVVGFLAKARWEPDNAANRCEHLLDCGSD